MPRRCDPAIAEKQFAGAEQLRCFGALWKQRRLCIVLYSIGKGGAGAVRMSLVLLAPGP
jgi:hypothetical protein